MYEMYLYTYTYLPNTYTPNVLDNNIVIFKMYDGKQLYINEEF